MKREKRIKVSFRIYPFSQSPITGKVYAEEDLIGMFQMDMLESEYKGEWTAKYHTDENGKEYREALVKPFGKSQAGVANSYKQAGIIVPWKIENVL